MSPPDGPRPSQGTVAVIVVSVAFVAAACSRSSPRGTPEDGPVSTGPQATSIPPIADDRTRCSPERAEKLGVTFVRLCDDAPTVSGSPRAFWISTTPMSCSGGDHDTLRCPPVIALSSGPHLPSSRSAAVVESVTAHRVCTMRFNGRLPTRVERIRARSALGLATVVVFESPESGGVRLAHLAEWVTGKPCDQPTVLGDDCAPARFPWDGSPNVPWQHVIRCEARRAEDAAAAPFDRSVIDVNGACPFRKGPDAGPIGELPCVIRDNELGAGGSRTLLACDRPNAMPQHAASIADVASFRCVIDDWR